MCFSSLLFCQQHSNIFGEPPKTKLLKSSKNSCFLKKFFLTWTQPINTTLLLISQLNLSSSFYLSSSFPAFLCWTVSLWGFGFGYDSPGLLNYCYVAYMISWRSIRLCDSSNLFPCPMLLPECLRGRQVMLHLLWMKSQFINEMTGDANVSSFQMHNWGDLPPPENSNMKIPDLFFFWFLTVS